MGLRPSHLVLAALAVAAALTFIDRLGGTALAQHDPALGLAGEFVATLIAATAALLVIGRFRERGRVGDLALAASLAVLAVASLAFAAIPAESSAAHGPFSTWASLTVRLVGAGAFAASPFLLGRVIDDRRRALALTLVAIAAGLAVVAAVVGAAGARLPDGVATGASGETFAWGRDGHRALLVGQLATMTLFLVAALGFVRRARVNGDVLVHWLAPASVLAAAAYLNFALFPSLYSPWVGAGDALRMTFYLLVFVGAAREVAGYQRERANAAVLEERRRLARDLHDGLAQELAFLVTQTRLLAGRNPDFAELQPIEATAQRALDESRLAIAALTRVGYEPLEVAVAAAAEEIAERTGVGVRLELARGIDVPPPVKEAMVRIVREAVTNAIRHGSADEVRVELANGTGIRLRISDRGRGFDLANGGHRAWGFGITSMRERAEAVGATLTIASAPGAGTRVDVMLA